jgi:hypothetical protein
MRGRIIYPFILELAQLDTVSTEADPDAAGPLTSGYSDLFKEPVRVPDGSQLGTDARQETTIEVVAQIEPEVMERLQMMAGGDSPDGRLFAICHFSQLELDNLVDANGLPTIRKSDRLVAIKECTPAKDLVMNITNPPGLYVSQVQSRGFGFGRKRNLLMLEFTDRETGVRR